MTGLARAANPVRTLAAPLLATLVALAILVALGWWQLERKTWKEGLLSAIAARAYDPPVPIPPEAAWPAWTAAADEYRRVRLTGISRPDLAVAVHGLAEERRGQALQGFYLFVPVRQTDGSTVVVNRGFVPTELREAALATLRAEASPVTLVGLARAPETRGWFVPENDPARDSWFVRSLDDVVRARGLPRTAPFYVDADGTPNPGGWPRGGQTQLTLRNHHLQYALTWFGLAATLLGVFGVFATRRLQGGE